MNTQPSRRPRDPGAHTYRSTSVQELIRNAGRDQDFAKEREEQIGVAGRDQITEGRSVGNRKHYPWRRSWCNRFASASGSSIE